MTVNNRGKDSVFIFWDNCCACTHKLHSFILQKEIDSKRFFFKVLFIYLFLAALVFIAACGLSLVAASGGYSSLQCVVFSQQWLVFVVEHRLQACGLQQLWHARLSHCGSRALEHRAQLLRGMWDLPRPGLEPVSPALAGGFLTTVP